jgi:predicted regulator of Ras-like GTPase activity (Roadblock/LC7/MglB family)
VEALLSQLNAFPGVVGSLLADDQGRVLASAFPPAFDAEVLSQLGLVAAEGIAGLNADGPGLRTLGLRYGDAQVVVRPLAGASLVFLCTRNANPQPLLMSAAAAAPRVERLVAQRQAAPAPQSAGARGRIHGIVQRIDAVIARRHLDRFRVRGEIAIRAGFALDFADPDAVDDPARVARLLEAALGVLGESV